MTLGQALRKARNQQGYSLRKLGERAGSSHHHIWLLEHDRQSPSANTLQGLAKALGVQFVITADDVQLVSEARNEA